MKASGLKKVFSLLIVLTFIVQQTGFAQAVSQLDISKYMTGFSGPEKFRPVQLRYFSYNPLTDTFQVLIDKGDVKNASDSQVREKGQELLKYFLVGIALPDENFWVNLRPDSENEIINQELAKTDVGKVLLEADLQLKKDVARFTSPETVEGAVYWNELSKKAAALFGSENVTMPTLIRPWIIPAEVIIRESGPSAFVYKATLKVMLEQDHLKNSATFNFSDKRLKTLNEYSAQLIRQSIIPQLTKEVNSSPKYAALRQVFNSLILARWFKGKFAGTHGVYASLINSGNLQGLTSAQPWSKSDYFSQYQKSVTNGEYHVTKEINGAFRTFFSGGIALRNELQMPRLGASSSSSPIGTFIGSNPLITRALGNGMVSLTGKAEGGQLLPSLITSLFTGGKRIASSPLQIRKDFSVPEGQPKGFFTNDYHSYRISELFSSSIEKIPDAVVNAVRNQLNQDIAQGKILSAVVKDFGGTDIDVQVTHRYGELNAAVQRLIIEALKAGALKAQELGLLKQGIIVNSMSLADLAKAMRLKYQTHSITERKSEPVVIVKMVGAGIGAANVKLYHEFFMPGSTPLQKLGFTPTGKVGVRGFRAIVRRTDDVLKGNFNGPVWEFENSSAFEDTKGTKYLSKNEGLELLALASQPNDFLITSVYAVEGSTLPSTEPVISVVYQPVYGEAGNLRSLNPTFICRSQSGADAVGGIASMFYDVNFVPGGDNGERYVVTKPVTLNEARIAPKEGVAHVVVYGWQSKDNGAIPTEKDGIIDHVAINPPALGPERRLADWLASIMTTHQWDQPYLSPFAAQERVDPLRNKQSHLFTRAPKEADIDPVMNEVEAKVANGQYLSVTDDKADMGGKFGHNFTPEYMLAIDRATTMEAAELGKLSDGNIIGFTDKARLKRGTTVSIGDDSHILMLGDKSRNSSEGHQLSFLAFTRGYLAAVVSGEKPYGLAQDFAGKEAKAAMANPYFYSRFNTRFFEILRQVMPLDHMRMVDLMEEGWKKWEATKETTTVLTKGFSGNVSNQGIGSARYLVDVAGGEREFGILAGDKMGPAALNRPIREGVYAALKGGAFKNGLVFEIWDAKAFDEHGNIPLDELPELFADVVDSLTSLKNTADQDYVRNCYTNGVLRNDLVTHQKERLAQFLKQSGYVPSKRIFLDARADEPAIHLYLADSDRFNIKQVWSKTTTGWNIEMPKDYLDKPVLGSSVTKLGILAGGEYIGKDDPVMVGNMELMRHIFEFLRTNPLIIQGDMNGSHWLAAIPTAAKYAVANKESHPILVGLKYTLSNDGKALASVEDIFGSRAYSTIRNKMFKFDFEFKKAQLGGQFEPYGTNWRTVEASYPLAKLLRALQSPESPFLVKNKPEADRATRPIGIAGEIVNLINTATASSSPITINPIRTPLVGGNWKMALASETDAVKLLEQLAAQIGNSEGVETVIAPSVLHIPAVSAALKKLVAQHKVAEGAIKIAAQNMYSEEKGAFTGGTSAAQLSGYYGVSHVILGHSEVRRNKNQEPTGESSANVNRKAIAALKSQLIPIVCVGESDAERTAGKEKPVVEQMLRASLAGISAQDAANIVVAYEPVWAIGTGKSATAAQAQEMHFFIRSILTDMFGAETSVKMRILYGGSVTADNIAGLKVEPDIDGALVGGASLRPDNFGSIVKITSGAQSSSPIAPNETVGGIDLRTISLSTQPMGNLSGLNFSLPRLSNAEKINLGSEFAQIQKMLKAGITPSGERLKEYVAACYQKGVLKEHTDEIVASLVNICKLEEERVDTSTTEFKEVLLMLDSMR
jgi:triosephosphate isomerase